ncbi:PAP/25A associated domain containing protein [Aphelenchoides avenae]|nr:PAP/25A associated domain containing protein [Aphelenchus avenae]
MDLCLAIRTQGFYSTRKANVKLGAVAKAWQRSGRFTDVQHINRAKVPIVRFTSVEGNRQISIDLSYNRIYGVYNTHLLSHYAKLDNRFPMLCVAVRGWAKAEGILNARSKTFNSYTLNLLVLHYLVHATEPPVLPDLQAAYPEFFGLGRPLETLYNNEALPLPLQAFPKNEQGTGELLSGFFMYFASFDFASYAVSISNGGFVQRAKLPALMTLNDPGVDRNPVVVIDPYEPVNPARTIKAASFPIVMTAFRTARDALCSVDAPPSLHALGLNVNEKHDIDDAEKALGG